MPLKTRDFTGTTSGPHLLITGGVHGDEFEPMAAIRELIRHVEPETLRGRLTLVPVVNEPAFTRGHRTGDDGLDLARTCPGRSDGRPTERIAAELSTLIRAADAYIDLHTGGTRLSVLPLVGYTLHANAAVREQQRRMARAFGLPLIWGTDPNLDGRSLSVARDAQIPAIYAEYHGAAVCDPAGVQAYIDGCLNVMGMLGMIDRTPAARAEPLVVEDLRPQSGHMQVCHPAPTAGYFAPVVRLGQRVEAGELLGTVDDVLGESRAEVRADHAGLVVVLHTFPSVAAGDALAVVIECPAEA